MFDTKNSLSTKNLHMNKFGSNDIFLMEERQSFYLGCMINLFFDNKLLFCVDELSVHTIYIEKLHAENVQMKI